MKRDESLTTSTRTDSRRGKLAACHQGTGVKALPVPLKKRRSVLLVVIQELMKPVCTMMCVKYSVCR